MYFLKVFDRITESNEQVFTTHANYASDGGVIMEPIAHVRFMTRGYLNHCLYSLLQLPSEYEPQIDSDKFLESFSFSINGQRTTTGTWDLAPGWRAPSSPSSTASRSSMTLPSTSLMSQVDIRKTAAQEWFAYFTKYSRHVPTAVAMGWLEPLTFRQSLIDEETARYRYHKSKRSRRGHREDSPAPDAIDKFQGHRPAPSSMHIDISIIIA